MMRDGISTQAMNAPTASSYLLPLQLEQVGFRAGGKTLLEAVSLTIEAGSRTLIMGPNGAGKSLLLRICHGLLEPGTGRVRWVGGKGRETRLTQAMVFQRPVLLRRSVAANMDFVFQLRGGRDDARRDALLAQVGLLERSRQPARLLSGGEQQRLALARALATEPEILFLDEPTASLDPASVLVIEDIVTRASKAGTKVIFVTHDIGQARRLGDDIVFLDRGRLVEHTPGDRFFATPATNIAAAYLDGRIVV